MKVETRMTLRVSGWNKFYGHLYYIGNIGGRKAGFGGKEFGFVILSLVCF